MFNVSFYYVLTRCKDNDDQELSCNYPANKTEGDDWL